MSRRKSTELAVPRQQVIAVVGDGLLADTGGLVYNADVAGEGIVAVGLRGARRYLGTVEVLTEAADTSPNVSSGVAREAVRPFLGVTQQFLLEDVIDTQGNVLAVKRAADAELRR